MRFLFSSIMSFIFFFSLFLIGCVKLGSIESLSQQAHASKLDENSIESYCAKLNAIGLKANDENKLSGCWILVTEKHNKRTYLNHGNLTADLENKNNYESILAEGGYLIDTNNYGIYACKIGLDPKSNNNVHEELFSGESKNFFHLIYSRLVKKWSVDKNSIVIEKNQINSSELHLKRDDGVLFSYLNNLKEKESKIYNSNLLKEKQCSFPTQIKKEKSKETLTDFILSLNSISRLKY